MDQSPKMDKNPKMTWILKINKNPKNGLFFVKFHLDHQEDFYLSKLIWFETLWCCHSWHLCRCCRDNLRTSTWWSTPKHPTLGNTDWIKIQRMDQNPRMGRTRLTCGWQWPTCATPLKQSRYLLPSSSKTYCFDALAIFISLSRSAVVSSL